MSSSSASSVPLPHSGETPARSGVWRFFDLGKKAVMAWVDDLAPSMGAAISYYTMFSLAPLLVIVIAVAGAIFGREAVQGEIVVQLQGLIGRDGALAVQGLIKSASEPAKGIAAGLISAVVLVIGATTVFAELQSALDRIWHVPEREKPTGVWAILRARVLSFGLILGLAFLLMVSLSVSAAVAAFGTWTSGLMPGWGLLLQAFNILLSIGISTVLFALQPSSNEPANFGGRLQALDLLRLDPGGRVAHDGFDMAVGDPFLVETRRLGGNGDVVGQLPDDVGIPFGGDFGERTLGVEQAGGDFAVQGGVHRDSPREQKSTILRVAPEPEAQMKKHLPRQVPSSGVWPDYSADFLPSDAPKVISPESWPPSSITILP